MNWQQLVSWCESQGMPLTEPLKSDNNGQEDLDIDPRVSVSYQKLVYVLLRETVWYQNLEEKEQLDKWVYFLKELSTKFGIKSDPRTARDRLKETLTFVRSKEGQSSIERQHADAVTKVGSSKQ